MLQVGEYEMLLDQILLFAAKARAAGVAVSCTPAPEMVHVYQMFPNSGDVATSEPKKSLVRIGKFMNAVTSRKAPKPRSMQPVAAK
jgi:acetyl esterase/lipase